jgi:GTP-binding protein HflX
MLAETVPLQRIAPATFIGGGKCDDYAAIIKEQEITLFIVDESLTPIQQRNLEERLQCKVIDRTALILEIFGERARTREGRLQVELAALNYQKSRLVRSWTHLERQRGGGGFMGGPGEKQIESDRRALAHKIVLIKRQLESVIKTRELHRKSRKAIPYPIISLVGYTNAGKSTLFNRLTKASVLAKDQLFATLDPTMRILKLPSGRQVIFSDTVGFISNLPTELVAAFRATLEEVLEADILLHVRDISHAETVEQKQDVEQVLAALGVDESSHKAVLEILNKIDKIPDEQAGLLTTQTPNKVALSALTGVGCDTLLDKIDRILASWEEKATVRVALEDGQTLAWIHAHSHVLHSENNEETGISTLRLEISDANLGRLLKRKGVYSNTPAINTED